MLYWSAGMGTATPAWLHGGDYDGDLNMFSFDKDFIDVVKATEGRIRQLPVEDLDQQVKDCMMELELEKAMDEEVEFELRGYFKKKELEALFAGDNKLPAYLQFCLWLPTPRLRGWACARAERIAHCALKQRSAAAWNLFFRAALTAHKAMDVLAESLVKAMDEVGKEAKIERKTRSTKAACNGHNGLCRPCGATVLSRPWRHGWMTDALVLMVQSGFHARQWCWGRRRRRRCWKRCSTTKRSQVLRAVGHQEAHSGDRRVYCAQAGQARSGAGQIFGC